MDERTWFEGVSDSSMKIVKALKSDNDFCGRDFDHFAKDNLSIFYRYDISSNSSSNPTIVTISKSSSSEDTDTEMLFSSVSQETLLLLQEALLHHYSGGEGTLINCENSGYKTNGPEFVYETAYKSEKLVFRNEGKIQVDNDDEDIFQGVGGIFDHKENKRTRARSLERSLTPDLDEFIEDIYNLKDNISSDPDVHSYSQIEVTKDDFKDRNTIHQDFRLVSRKKNRKKGIDYSLFSRKGPTRAFEKSLRDFKLPQFEDSTSSYAECYLEVDGVSQYETHHEELEPASIRSHNKELDDSLSLGSNTKQNANKYKKDKSVNREWNSIQKIINKQNFRSLETFNSLISNNNC